MNSDSHQVKRTLKFRAVSQLQVVADSVQSIEGVVSVEADAARKRLHITYDITRLSWGVLCDALKETGLYTPGNWIARWRDGWRDQLDQNMRDNLAHRPACCSKPPPGSGQH